MIYDAPGERGRSGIKIKNLRKGFEAKKCFCNSYKVKVGIHNIGKPSPNVC